MFAIVAPHESNRQLNMDHLTQFLALLMIGSYVPEALALLASLYVFLGFRESRTFAPRFICLIIYVTVPLHLLAFVLPRFGQVAVNGWMQLVCAEPSKPLRSGCGAG